MYFDVLEQFLHAVYVLVLLVVVGNVYFIRWCLKSFFPLKIILEYNFHSEIKFFQRYIFWHNFIWDRTHKQGERAEVEGDSDSPLRREPWFRVSILWPWDHDRNWKQTLNWLSHPSAPWHDFCWDINTFSPIFPL